ncbi:acyltransferase [Aeromonas sp. CU5]|uniref:acyltransferase n=1 Tax=Aeromonas sp. CU5 TaxID=2033033 RepID=UPI0012FE1484|nr:acyltransferase [Aeromonas sp. CU5]
MENKLIVITASGERLIKTSVDGLQVSFSGTGNSVTVYEGTDFHKCQIICGSGTNIHIGKTRHHVKHMIIAGRRATNAVVRIGDNFSCVGCQINMNESGSVYIGNDCMFSFGITIWTSDGHTMFDNDTLECLNQGKDVIIGNHVWVGYHVNLMKGSVVSDNSVVGACSVVVKHFNDTNVAIGGVPAKVLRHNINWSRQSPENYMKRTNEMT